MWGILWQSSDEDSVLSLLWPRFHRWMAPTSPKAQLEKKNTRRKGMWFLIKTGSAKNLNKRNNTKKNFFKLKKYK